MNRPRTRSAEPVLCECTRRKHFHGTASMYQDHLCGCDPCTRAYTEYRAGRRGFSEQDPTATAGVFVATFPVHGGISQARASRQAYDQLLAMTREQGVVVKGEWSFRMEATPQGVFLTARAPAETDRPRAEVIAAAELFAYEHERAHPLLTKWINRRLEQGVAA